MVASLLALQITTRTWYGGTTNEFALFLSSMGRVPYAIDAGHVPTVPRRIFSRTDSAKLPVVKDDVYTARSIGKTQVYVGTVFSPRILDPKNYEDNFRWAADGQESSLANQSAKGTFSGTCTVGQLFRMGERKLHPPASWLEKVTVHANFSGLSPTQIETLAAEMIDHDIIKTETRTYLAPRVVKLREKILRSLREYMGPCDTSLNAFEPLNVEFLEQLPLEDWRYLLSEPKAYVTKDITGTTWETRYGNIFSALYRVDKKKEAMQVQSFFSESREPGLKLIVSNNFWVSKTFYVRINGDRTWIVY